MQTIPGLAEGFVPQGVTRVGEEGSLLICGYMAGDAASRVYVCGQDGSVRKILLQYADGKTYSGHAGGLTAAGDFVYISNASQLFVLDTKALLGAPDGSSVAFLGSFEVPCRSSFCSSVEENVYVGEYHAPGYETKESHQVKTADGESYQAIVFAYKLNAAEEWGVEKEPSAAFAVCDAVQGFAVTPAGQAVLSCSSGFKDSLLRIYDLNTKKEADASFSEGERSMPLYILDSARLVKTIKMPHMSEDLDYRGGGLLMGFEAGAKKFGLGLLPLSIRKIVKIKTD